MRRFRHLTVLSFALASVCPAPAGPVMLQYFESRWETIEKKLPDVFTAGYSAFWLPPPGKADTGGYSVGYDVYDRFDLGKPFDQTLYGTEAGTKQLVRASHRAGLDCYFDYVANHNGFRDMSTPGFDAAGGYPGFVLTLPDDIDGDFHGAYDSGDLNMRLAGLIDIAQEKNHVFVRHPVVADPLNIPRQTPKPENRRFYPDVDLPANSLGIHPFNLNDPMAGDPTAENATGLLLRYTQWMLEVIGADGFRIDAEKHIPAWYFSSFFDNVCYQRGRPDLNGNPRTPFSFGEVYTGDFGVLGQYIRKDGFGNRDVLDFPLYFTIQNVFNAGGYGDMRQLEFASVDGIDGNANDGSAGMTFVSSHDNGPPALDNVAYAYILTRTGFPIVYFNAHEFGTGRSFPTGGRGDALGGDYGDLIPRLVDIARRYAKGIYYTRSIDEDVFVYERDNSLLVGLNDRGDAGYDTRTVPTNFRNVTLVELTGNAADPVVNANHDIFSTITIGGDGMATIRVPRNKTNSVAHNSGFVMYGLAVPAQTQTIAPVTQVLAPETTAVANGVRRLTPLQVITGTTFSVTVQTAATPAEDNALIKLDGGRAIDANPGVFITSGEFAGFEEFTGVHSSRAANGSGTYSLTIDATALEEGQHFIDTVAFLPRPAGSPAAYSSKRSVIYVDRVPPPVTLISPSTTGTSDVQSQSYTVVAQCPDFTADSMHVFFDKPANYDFVGNVGSATQMTRVDRNEFRYTWNNITSGNHSITIVAFEPTGNHSVTRFEPVNAVVPQPDMALGVDLDFNTGSSNFQPVPATISLASYPYDFVVRVNNVGRSFPADFTVSLDVDGVTYQAQPYSASLLPPVNRLVQNDQNLGDSWDEFRFRWTGYTRGTHSFEARARLTSGAAPENRVSAIVQVPDSVAGPSISILSPAPGTVLNAPGTVNVTLGTDSLARSAAAYITVDGVQQLIAMKNDFGTTTVALSATAGNYYQSDAGAKIQLRNGTWPIRAVVSTAPDGAGISSEAMTSIIVTGMGDAPVTTGPVIDGNISEFFDRAPLAVSAADGAGSSASVADFGADGSLTELHGRVRDGVLYLAVRGDMFDGTDPNVNATIVYIDVDGGAGTGAKKMTSTSDLSDVSTAKRQLVTNSGFQLSSALVTQGIGFDAAIILNGTSPLDYEIVGFGTGGVVGSTSSFASLSGNLAFGRGLQSYPGAAGTTIAGPSGFEVSIPLSVLGNANPRQMRFVAVTTSDTSYPSPNTLPENAQNTFDSVQTLDAVAAFPTYPALRLNEVDNGEPDWVEIYNPTGSAVDVSQWSLRWADGNGLKAYVPLSGLTVAAHGYSVVADGALTPSVGEYRLSSNLPWYPTRPGSAALVDPYGLGVDYVRWTALDTSSFGEDAPAGTAFTGWATGFDSQAANRTLSRDVNSTDTDQAQDWSLNGPTPASANTAVSVVASWMEYQ
jgi:alpha-amylase